MSSMFCTNKALEFPHHLRLVVIRTFFLFHYIHIDLMIVSMKQNVGREVTQTQSAECNTASIHEGGLPMTGSRFCYV